MKGLSQSDLSRSVAALILVAISMFIWSCIPSRPESYSALPVAGQIGDKITGRNISATVHSVYASRHISAEIGTLGVLSHDYYSQGYWIVVDTTYGTLVKSSRLSPYLQSGSTRTGLRTNVGDISSRPLMLQPGLRYRSVLVFEVPEMGDVMKLDLLNSFQDERTGEAMDPPLDSQITVSISRQSVQVRSRIVLDGFGVRQ